jgi:hypothetical protein
MRILAQESPDSELLLKRSKGNKFEGLKLKFWKGSGGIFKNTEYVEGFFVNR